MRVLPMTAEFARVKDAVEFVERYLSQGRSSESDVSRKSKTVTWDANLEDESPRRAYEYTQDLAENVGCVGNYGGRKAKLNGRVAPTEY